MSQLKLTADSGGGTVAIKAPASTTGNAAIELTVPGTGSGTLAIGDTGKILQVVNVIKTDTFTTTDTNHTSAPFGTAVTGLTASITPSSASNKILVTLMLGLTNSNANFYSYAYLYRGTTLLGATTAISAGGGLGIQTKCLQRLDTPNTTSSTTYSVRLAAEGNTAKIGEGAGGTSDNRVDDATITLMEVAV
tara:strand:+ start:528 stop:1103 length:576 start_codon:yes stop_codon:yes gene_type:complete